MASDTLRKLYRELELAKRKVRNEDSGVLARTDAANEVLRLEERIAEMEKHEGKYSNKIEGRY